MKPGIVAESDLGGNLKSEYVFFDGGRAARKDFSGGTTSVAYYFSDHLETASVITNSAGTIIEDEDYYPWGGELQFVNSDSNHYKFTSKERDSETGLDYFGARYYGNWTGRFLTADWAAKPVTVPYASFGDPQSLNLYSYVKNNPTTLVDLDGHQCDICQIVAQKIGVWAGEGIAAEGGKQFTKDAGIGFSKGVGTSGFNTLKMAAAVGNPVAAVSILMQPNPKALQPSNPVQAGASYGAQVAVGAASIVASGFGAAGEGTTALSLSRLTGEGESFTHYGFLADADKFAGGLRAGGYATSESGLSGAEAQSGLALPHEAPPDAAYPVSPTPGTPVFENPTTAPNFNQPGGLPETQFPLGTGPGTVGPPKPIDAK